MNIKNYSAKLAVASVALISSIITFAPKAIAQSATFNFSETITPGCDLSGFTAAAGATIDLEANGTNNGLITPNPASFSIACNFAGAQINITSASEDVAETAADSLTATLEKITGTTGTSTSNGGVGNTILDLEASSNDFNLELETDHSTNGLIAGTYNYNVVVTVTGNN